MNKLTIIGNLTNNPVRCARADGSSSANFTVAVNRKFKDAGGNVVTDFFSVWVGGRSADNCMTYLSKGKKVAVGELQAKKYEKRDGSVGFSLNVSADEVEFLTPKKSDEGAPAKPEDLEDANDPRLPWGV